MEEIRGEFYFNTNENFIQYKMNQKLLDLIENSDKSFSRIAFICIGTDRSTGDSFGPLTGHNISRYTIYDFDLYGTIFEPVHALNLKETLEKIDMKSTLVIAIDSCLGNFNRIGYISMGYGGIKPGSGVGKDIPPVGDIHISGIVNVAGFMPAVLLQTTRLATVYRMSEMTAHAIQSVLFKKYYKPKQHV